MWRRVRNANVLLHVRAYGDSPVSLAMTHMRWLRGLRGRGSTDYTMCVSLGVGGLQAWLIDRCSTQGRGQA